MAGGALGPSLGRGGALDMRRAETAPAGLPDLVPATALTAAVAAQPRRAARGRSGLPGIGERDLDLWDGAGDGAPRLFRHSARELDGGAGELAGVREQACGNAARAGAGRGAGGEGGVSGAARLTRHSAQERRAGKGERAAVSAEASADADHGDVGRGVAREGGPGSVARPDRHSAQELGVSRVELAGGGRRASAEGFRDRHSGHGGDSVGPAGSGRVGEGLGGASEGRDSYRVGEASTGQGGQGGVAAGTYERPNGKPAAMELSGT